MIENKELENYVKIYLERLVIDLEIKQLSESIIRIQAKRPATGIMSFPYGVKSAKSLKNKGGF